MTDEAKMEEEEGKVPPGWRRPYLSTIIRYLEIQPEFCLVASRNKRGNVVDWDVADNLPACQEIAKAHRKNMPHPEYKTLIANIRLIEENNKGDKMEADGLTTEQKMLQEIGGVQELEIGDKMIFDCKELLQIRGKRPGEECSGKDHLEPTTFLEVETSHGPARLMSSRKAKAVVRKIVEEYKPSCNVYWSTPGEGLTMQELGNIKETLEKKLGDSCKIQMGLLEVPATGFFLGVNCPCESPEDASEKLDRLLEALTSAAP